jgi:hypothetical protein
MSTTLIDFVARGETPDEWRLVIVEEGPWHGSIESQLRRVQDRLYGAMDAALDGEVASRFPESVGKKFVIQFDGYNLPDAQVEAFFDDFRGAVLQTPDYKAALVSNSFVKDITFRINLASISQ